MLIAASIVFMLQPYVGIGQGDLNWNIAQDLSGQISPNVLSELKFEKLRSVQAGLAGEARLPLPRPDLQLLIEGQAGYGEIRDGRVSDADFSADNRSVIGSLSESRVRGDDLEDYSAGLGFAHELPGPEHSMSFLIGGFFQSWDINFHKGRQLIADPAFFPFTSVDALTRNLQLNLDSSYLAEWSGYWLAGRYEVSWRDWEFGVRYQYQRGDYYGEGRWNLRRDGPFALQQPKSFSHDADSSGGTWRLDARYHFSETLGLQASYLSADWDTDAGRSHVYSAGGGVAVTRLNEVEQRSSQLNFGLSYTFR